MHVLLATFVEAAVKVAIDTFVAQLPDIVAAIRKHLDKDDAS